MILLGVDPGYRHMGLCLVEANKLGVAKVLKKATLKNGALKDWQRGLPKLVDKLEDFIGLYNVEKAGVEMIVWYGKRKGVLALAHLAGACYTLLLTKGFDVRFFLPKDVKNNSLQYHAPQGFDEHQHDALSICRLLANQS